MLPQDLHITHKAQNPLFRGILVLFFIVAFLQVFLFGFGMYKKLKAPPIVRIEEKIIEKEVPIYIEREPITPSIANIPKPRKLIALPDLPPLPAGFASQTNHSPSNNQGFIFSPPVESPKEEKLLKEARNARIIGDMRALALKLSEAQKNFPNSPHTDFMFADMYEAMGIFDKAAQHYENVFLHGITKAGPLYHEAAKKLQEGFSQTNTYADTIKIGTVGFKKDPTIQTGEKVQLTIPIISSPEEKIDPAQVEVSVKIYDKIDDQIVLCLPSNKAICEWRDDIENVNWSINGTEHLIADYYLPNEPLEESFNSLSPRAFYGYVIELSYRGQIQDQYSWPRILATYAFSNRERSFSDFNFDDLEIDLDSENILLPPIAPSQY